VQKYTHFNRSQETINLQIVINPKSYELISGSHQNKNLKCCKTYVVRKKQQQQHTNKHIIHITKNKKQKCCSVNSKRDVLQFSDIKFGIIY
jgi:hypothetical protein